MKMMRMPALASVVLFGLYHRAAYSAPTQTEVAISEWAERQYIKIWAAWRIALWLLGIKDLVDR